MKDTYSFIRRGQIILFMEVHSGGPDGGACDPRGRGLPTLAPRKGEAHVDPRLHRLRCSLFLYTAWLLFLRNQSINHRPKWLYDSHLGFGFFFWAVSLSDDALLKVMGQHSSTESHTGSTFGGERAEKAARRSVIVGNKGEMMRGTNTLIGAVNFVTFLISIPILGGGIWLSAKANSTDCLRFLQWPLIIIGVAIMVISLMGFAGACYRLSWLLRLYLFAMFFVVTALLGFVVFAFAVTDRGQGQVVMNRAFLEYQLSDYSGWLKDRVSDPGYWVKISACLREGHACSKMTRYSRDPTTGLLVPESPDMFYRRNLSPIEVSTWIRFHLFVPLLAFAKDRSFFKEAIKKRASLDEGSIFYEQTSQKMSSFGETFIYFLTSRGLEQ
ncbi:hypothetical protein BHE74_00053245 [Ensete ventricosum]|nr:hypothetical protein BHE74_00053245 [Ensete ventricosum]